MEHGSLIRECSGHLRSKLRRVLRTLGLTVLRFGVNAPKRATPTLTRGNRIPVREVPTGTSVYYHSIGREFIEGDAPRTSTSYEAPSAPMPPTQLLICLAGGKRQRFPLARLEFEHLYPLLLSGPHVTECRILVRVALERAAEFSFGYELGSDGLDGHPHVHPSPVYRSQGLIPCVRHSDTEVTPHLPHIEPLRPRFPPCTHCTTHAQHDRSG